MSEPWGAQFRKQWKESEIPLQRYVVFYIIKNNTVLYKDVSFVLAT